MYQFKASYSVVEVRENLAKMVRRGFLPETKMITIVRKFAEQKQQVQEGQKYIVILED